MSKLCFKKQIVLAYISVHCENVVLYRTVHHVALLREDCKIFKFCCLNSYELPLYLCWVLCMFLFSCMCQITNPFVHVLCQRSWMGFNILFWSISSKLFTHWGFLNKALRLLLHSFSSSPSLFNIPYEVKERRKCISVLCCPLVFIF